MVAMENNLTATCSISLQLDQIYNMDCIEGMKLIADNSINCVLADPPFGFGFSERQNYNRNHDLVVDEYEDIDEQDYYDISHAWMEQAKRIIKPSGSILIISGYNRLVHILNAGNHLKLHLVNQLIWRYPFGVRAIKKFVTGHYNILLYCKNERKRAFYPNCRFSGGDRTEEGKSARYADMQSVIYNINRENWTGCKKIPTKLPLELCKKLLAYTTKEGDTMVDPFVGTGQGCWAARDLGLHYYGFEVKEAHYKFAKQRLDNNQYLIK